MRRASLLSLFPAACLSACAALAVRAAHAPGPSGRSPVVDDEVEHEAREARPDRGPRLARAPGPPVPPAPPAPGGPTWTCLGPFRGSAREGAGADTFQTQSGRPTAVVAHPKEPFTLYLAGSGGLFRTKNADPDAVGEWAWEPLIDGLPLLPDEGLAVGDLALDPDKPEEMFVGLGDPLADLLSGSLFVSHDGGDSWQKGGGLGESSVVWKVLPLGNGAVLVGTDEGLFRSSDGGASFTKASFETGQPEAKGAVQSIARLGDGTLVAGRFSVQDGTFGKLYTSKDGGLSWQMSSLPDPPPSPLTGRFSLASAPSTCCTAFAIADNVNSVLLGGVFRTDDSGKTWAFVAPQNGGFDQGQGFYNQALAIDPDDASHLFVGSQLGFYRSLDAGLSWQPLGGSYGPRMHADSHVATWWLSGKKALLVGHDGGLSLFRDPLRAAIPPFSDTPDQSFVDNRRNRGLATDQAYTLASTTAETPPGSRDRVLMGTQDNGLLVRVDDGAGLGASGRFDLAYLADGYGTLLHPHDGSLALAGSNGGVFRSTDGGASWGPVSAFFGENLLWDVPFTLGEADPSGNTVYVVGNDHVFVTHDFGLSFELLPRQGIDDGEHFMAVAASRLDPQRLAAVTYQSVYLSADGGSSWAKAKTPPLTTPRSVTIDGFDPATLYVTSHDRPSPSRLCRSTDGGKSWQPIDGTNGPNGFPLGVPVYQIKTDPLSKGVVYAGTDVGLFRSPDGGASWSPLGSGLPRVPVRDIYLAPDRSFVRLATYGRGIWQAPLDGAGGAGGSGSAGNGGSAGDSGAAGASGASGQGGAGVGAAGEAGQGGSSGKGGAAGQGGQGGFSGQGGGGGGGFSGEGGAAGQGGQGGSSGKGAGAGEGGQGGSSGKGGGAGAAASGGEGGSLAAAGASGPGGAAGASAAGQGGSAGSPAMGGGAGEASEGDEGGCGCRVVTGRGGLAPGLWLVGLVGLLASRRRRGRA